MGFKLFGRKGVASSDSSRSASTAPSSSSESPTALSFTAPASAPKGPSRFTNALRAVSAPAPSTSQPRSRPALSVIPVGYAGRDSGDGTATGSSWDDVERLSSSGGQPRSPSAAPVRVQGHSTTSLPLMRASLPSEGNGGSTGEQKKTSRWKLGLGARRRSVSASVDPVRGGKGDTLADSDKTGFVVMSFRSVSRVHEDPVAQRYPTLPYGAALPTPYAAPPLVAAPANSTSPSSYSRIEAGSYRASERAPSPTISVEAFRFASARRASAVFDEDTQQRPRFQPSRSSRSSIIDSVGPPTPVAPPRAHVGESNPSAPSSNRSSPVQSPHKSFVTASGSRQSLASFQTATEGSPGPRMPRSRTMSMEPLDDDLRFIALYGSGEATIPSNRLSRTFPSAPRPNDENDGGHSPPKAKDQFVHASRSTPALALLPATPSPTTTRRAPVSPTVRATRSFPSPRAEATSSTLRGSSQPKTIDWNADTDSSDDEDDVPLARLPQSRGASMIDLTLQPSELNRALSLDQKEVLNEDAASPSASSFSGRMGTAHPANKPSLDPVVPTFAGDRHQQRRSISTLSVAMFPPESVAPRSPVRDNPSLGHRAFSSPALVSRSMEPSYSGPDLPPLPPFDHSPPTNPEQQQRLSATSSSSGSNSGSSQPRTPRDGSPGASVLGVRTGSQLGLREHSAKLDLQLLGSESRWNNRISVAAPPRSPMAQVNVRPSSSMGFNAAANARLPSRDSRLFSDRGGRPPQAALTSRSAIDLRSNRSPSKETEVYNRMKARHKLEAANAISLGRDLNGTGLMEDDEDEDDDVPLSDIPRGGSQAGSAYGGFSQQQMYHAPLSPHGAYANLASCPLGVDPYLYASLAPDQKQSLHLRAQGLLALMQQASYHAKAESDAGGWDAGSSMSGSGGRPQSQSYGYMPAPSSSTRLPPFAPSHAASASFYSQPSYHNPYGGYSHTSSSSSAIGSSGAGRQMPRRGAASTLGIPSARR